MVVSTESRNRERKLTVAVLHQFSEQTDRRQMDDFVEALVRKVLDGVTLANVARNLVEVGDDLFVQHLPNSSKDSLKIQRKIMTSC